MTSKPSHPFRLPGGRGVLAGVSRLFHPVVERALGLNGLAHIYGRRHELAPGLSFAEGILGLCGVRLEFPAKELEALPREGSLLVVANHPFGGIEGLALIVLLQRVRSDARVMGNYLLHRIPELCDAIVPVDPFGRPGAAALNRGPLLRCMRWLKQGKVLGVFPAGKVAHYQPSLRAVSDPPWSPTIGRLARSSGASVVPLFFAGRNSALFQLLGLIHPILRTALLPRQFLNKRGATLRLRIGAPIPPERLTSYASDQELTETLRARTYLLSAGLEASRPGAAPSRKRHAPIAPAGPPEELAEEVARLPEQDRLLENAEIQVLLAPASRIPALLQEIARLRELTFREIGEGSGKALDRDRFDAHYLHLFLWHAGRREVIGAYRLGLTDRIAREHGIAGLYTSTLFHYGPGLLAQISPAVELGRSFVRQEWQREFQPLMLLWKGIGKFVSLNPRYRNLFGPVSISSDYHDLSRRLLVRFLTDNNFDTDLARLCRPRNPLPRTRPQARDLWTVTARDIEEVSRLIAEIESRPRGVPILVRQYLKLGAQLLGFNVDPAFENCIDGLVRVDLARTPPRILARYLGRQEAEAFLAHHRDQTPAA